MKVETKHGRHDLKAAKPDIALLETPLDYIAEDHMREREVCAMIDRVVAGDPPNEDDNREMISFLGEQLPLHLQDEEIDLFPMMLNRCAPEDEIQKVIDKLLADHGFALSDTPAIVALLQTDDAMSVGLSEGARKQLTEFAAHARRHLILENAIILPLARVRLTSKDLKLMKQHMLERRGLDRITEDRTC